MATEESSRSKEEIIKYISINGISLEDLVGLKNVFEITIQRLYIENASILSVKIRELIKYQYLLLIQGCKNIVKCYELITELTILKAPINKSQEATFEGQISTARKELKELKSNYTIDAYYKRELVLRVETELKRLDKEVVDQFLLHVHQEKSASIKGEYITNVNQFRNVVKCYELIKELTKLNAPINKSQEIRFERQIITAREELKELMLNQTIDSYQKRVLRLNSKQN